MLRAVRPERLVEDDEATSAHAKRSMRPEHSSMAPAYPSMLPAYPSMAPAYPSMLPGAQRRAVTMPPLPASVRPRGLSIPPLSLDPAIVLSLAPAPLERPGDAQAADADDDCITVDGSELVEVSNSEDDSSDDTAN
jgi:hypothetical protein